jgi:hypothetical protein
VEFPTADYVTLRGHWYPSPQGKAAPTVLLLHALGEDSKKPEWINLAKSLQDKGYAVLRFDFRGHGDSTDINPGVAAGKGGIGQPGFWDQKENQNGLLTFKPATARMTREILFKQFRPEYYRILANDIAAAKAFADIKNDAGECNTSNLILIGAKDGATLGALWLSGEYHRYRIVGGKPDTYNPEGKNVTGAIWLSMSSTLGERPLNPGTMLYKAAASNKVPMLFLYGKGDLKGKKTADKCEEIIVKGKKKDYPFTFTYEVQSASVDKLSGVQLLQKPLGMTREITTYLDKALLGSPKHKQHLRTEDVYVWLVPDPTTGRLTQAVSRPRGAEPSIPFFSRYAAFLR